MECALSQHTLHVDMAIDGNVENKDGVSVLVNDDVGALMANIGGDFDRRRDGRVGDVVKPMITTLAVMACQLSLPNCFLVSF